MVLIILIYNYILTTTSIAAKIKIMDRYFESYRKNKMYFPGDHTVLSWGFKVLLLVVMIFATGCKTLEKPREFVEELRNPTSFPEVFSPAVENIDEIVKENRLAEDENIKIVPIGGNKNISAYVMQFRENAEMDAHYHKLHDEIIYVKKGSGILDLQGTRYNIREGMVFVIPRKSVHKFVNTGNELNVSISFFSPPFDGEDIELLEVSRRIKKKKKTIYDKGIKEREKEIAKEKGEKKSWLSFWKDSEKKTESGSEDAEQASEIIEEQKILIMTEEEKQKIREVQRKINEEERNMIERMVLNEKLKVLQGLVNEGLLSQEEYDAKRAEIISESKE